jgi:ubiquinol-cytochrome c reductase cytochrome b subunit
MGRTILDWIDSRTGYRALMDRLLLEPLPHGTGWFFTTGSVVTLLVVCQFVTGIGLSMYYVPSPVLAYDSLRYIIDDLPLGWLLHGLHCWGASFLVVAAVVHMTRVFLFGSYKAPREVTWLTGVALFLVILGFSLSGYLLPWDQKAYWATTVTINVARSAPLAGEWIASIMRGGPDLGALTLGRWFSAHVFLLPATLIALISAHIALMRRHGISGPIAATPGPKHAFYPGHVIKDTVMVAAVFATLFATAAFIPAHLDEIANPADASYIPRPEWYFLSLFQLLKYFPGPLEPIATMVVPGMVIGFLILLPFVDRGEGRHPLRGARRLWSAAMGVIALGVVVLTMLGLADRPAVRNPHDWGLLPIAGHAFTTDESSGCARCHVAGGPAAPLSFTRLSRDNEWLLAHMADPVAIAPGVRTDAEPAPKPVMSRFKAEAVVAYLRRLHSGGRAPDVGDDVRLAAQTYAENCVMCHKVSGDGGTVGPDLSLVGRRRDEAFIRAMIEDPVAATGNKDSVMPDFKSQLSAEQINGLARYLASRR